MSDCELKKYVCTYTETGCSDCLANQAYQQGKAEGRADAIADYDKWLATYNVSTDYLNHRIMVDRGGIKRYASDLYLEQLKEMNDD